MSKSDLHKQETKPSKKRSLAAAASASDTVAILSIGQVLSGRYKVVEKIGAGGMGIVYRVEDTKWDNRVFALKALPPDMAKSSAAIKRLKREADSAIDLRHQNIMALHSFDNDGTHHFLLMEYLDGPDLEEALADKERFSLDEVLDVARQVCPALDHAHERGVIHRDVKPGNLIYKNEGGKQIVKIADFGIAYQIRDSLARITGQDTTGGTMHYMPPEQLSGLETDARSDQYALASTLYELLRGRTPFQGAGGVLMRQIEEKQPVPIDGVPDHVNCALLKSLAKKPEDRFNSCKELLEALEGRLKVVASTEKLAPKKTSSGGRQALVVAAMCFIFFALLGLAEYSFALFGFFEDPEFHKSATAVTASPSVAEQTKEPIVATKAVIPTPLGTPVLPAASKRVGKVYISSEPTGASIFLDGSDTKMVTNTVLQDVSLGEHKVSLKKLGFKEQLLSLKLDDEKLKKMPAVKLLENWGRLRVVGSPKSATFKLLPVDHPNGPKKSFKFGDTVENLLGGKYLIEASAPLHHMETQDVTVADEAQTTTTRIELKPIRAKLSINSKPTGATIKINGVRHEAVTPSRLDLPCGTHRVELTKGLYSWAGSIELGEAGIAKTLSLSMSKIPITFSSTPAGAKVYCFNRTPASVGRIKGSLTVPFKPGKYRFKFANVKGYREKIVPFEVKVGGPKSLQVKLEKLEGFVKPIVFPIDAVVTVDGRHFRGTPLAFAPGKYRVNASRDGYVAASEYVNVTDGKTEVVALNLQKKAKPKKQGPRPGEEKTVAGIRFCWCPPGEFLMGSPYGEPGRDNWEGPQHRVRITKGFWLGKYEITIGQWRRLMGKNPARFRGDDRPIEKVNWFDCENFIGKLSASEGNRYKFRLPTEAEWEYACRAGTTTALYNGSIQIFGLSNAPALDPIAWYGGNCGTGNSRDVDTRAWKEKQYAHGRGGTHPVGQKVANYWGLHDMLGNVYEWCSDWYAAGYYSRSPVYDPKGPASGSQRVHRGSSWSGAAKGTRSAARAFNPPRKRFHDLGFRVLLEH